MIMFILERWRSVGFSNNRVNIAVGVFTTWAKAEAYAEQEKSEGILKCDYSISQIIVDPVKDSS